MVNIFYLPILVAIYFPFTDYRHLKLWNIDRIFSSVQIYQKQETGNVDYSSNPHSFEEAEVLAIYIEPRFRGSIDELKKKTSVPIVFPSFIPPSSDGSRFNITVNIVSANMSSYELITGIKGCRGENVCRFCSLTGELITPETKTANQRYEELHKLGNHNFKPSEKSGYVLLSRDIQGFFIPFITGAYSSDSYIVWDQNGYRYSVGIKAGRLNKLVEMANSTIENQP